jgi:hypothetical protein
MIKTVKRKKGLSTKLTLPSIAYQRISKLMIGLFPYMPSNDQYNITVCHEKKFVWFRVAKVGTRTIFDTFQLARINLDAEHAMFCHYPTNLYKRYFKFAFVRNPWDRLVSCWQNKVVDSNFFNFSDKILLEMKTFKNFVDFVEHRNIELCDPHMQLQSKLIDLNNVDFIGRFENFEEDLSKVIKIIGVEARAISRKNVSKNKAEYWQYYDDKLKDKVAKIYCKDINILQYTF